MRYESGTKCIFLNLQMLVKCCFLEAILRYCGSGVEPICIINVCGALKYASPSFTSTNSVQAVSSGTGRVAGSHSESKRSGCYDSLL